MAELRWGAATHPGQLRPDNEDHLLAAQGVYVVADGMGGHEAGEVASELAVERIRDALADDGAAPTAERVVEAISGANGDIFRAAIANPGQAGMGTTVTAIAVIEDPMAGRGEPNIEDNDPIEPSRVTPIVPRIAPEALVLANVGDSRTYLLRHDRLRRVTIDHSYVQELVSTGHITDDEARTHPRRNIITRALGIEPDVKVDWWTLPLVRGDRFLLCSDGLVDEVPDAEIAATLLEFDDPQEAADTLVAQANEAGGRDNVTVIVLDVLDGDDPPDPTQELDLTPTWADDAPLGPDDLERLASGERVAIVADDHTAEIAAMGKVSRRQRRRDRKAAADRTDGNGPTDADPSDNDPSDQDLGDHDLTDHRSADHRSIGVGTDSRNDDDRGGSELRDDGGRTDRDAHGDDGGGRESDDDENEDGDRSAPAAAAPAAALASSGTSRKRLRLGRVVAVFVLLALLVSGFVATAAWARRGYFVDFDSSGEITVYQGRRGGVLWFEPTSEASSGVTRNELSGDSADLVAARPTFSGLSEAVLFIRALDVTAGADATDPVVTVGSEPATRSTDATRTVTPSTVTRTTTARTTTPRTTTTTTTPTGAP